MNSRPRPRSPALTVSLAASAPGTSAGFVFLDPPFGTPLLDAALPEAAARLAAGGAIYVEADASVDPARIETVTGLSTTRQSHTGASHFRLLRRP